MRIRSINTSLAVVAFAIGLGITPTLQDADENGNATASGPKLDPTAMISIEFVSSAGAHYHGYGYGRPKEKDEDDDPPPRDGEGPDPDLKADCTACTQLRQLADRYDIWYPKALFLFLTPKEKRPCFYLRNEVEWLAEVGFDPRDVLPIEAEKNAACYPTSNFGGDIILNLDELKALKDGCLSGEASCG